MDKSFLFTVPFRTAQYSTWLLLGSVVVVEAQQQCRPTVWQRWRTSQGSVEAPASCLPPRGFLSKGAKLVLAGETNQSQKQSSLALSAQTFSFRTSETEREGEDIGPMVARYCVTRFDVSSISEASHLLSGPPPSPANWSSPLCSLGSEVCT